MFGAIADDFTGATDLALMLRQSGHRVAVVIEDGGLSDTDLSELDAVVIALKSRTASREEAVAASLAALERLRSWGAVRFYVKYCSTFDSTDSGNIGPVLDAITDALGVSHCILVPALPANGRTVYQGHLFVGSDLLENSSMRHHPLTPMKHSRVADLLRPQTPHMVDEIFRNIVRGGSAVLRDRLDRTDARYSVIDAVDDDDLAVIGAATVQDVVVSGGSGLATGIAGPGVDDASWVPPRDGRGAVLCGSVSTTSLAQIANAALSQPVRQIDLAAAIADPEATAEDLATWVAAQEPDSFPVVCAARQADDVQTLVLGVEVAPIVERVIADVARRLVQEGVVCALIVAGGESSGAVVRSLNVEALRIGPQIAPGVCWSTADVSGQSLLLALKSGNFGALDLFSAAWKELG